MIASLVAWAALSTVPPVQVFTRRHTTWCEAAWANRQRLSDTPASQRDPFMSVCASWSVDTVECVTQAPTPERMATCEAPPEAGVANVAPYHPKDVQTCRDAADSPAAREACLPEGPCAIAVDILAEVSSADADISEAERAAAVKAVTSTKGRKAEVQACVRLPFAVRTCVESASSMSDLQACQEVERTWSRTSNAPMHPFRLAFQNDCERATAAWPRLYTSGGRSEALDCEVHSADTLRCLAQATTREASGDCVAAARGRCNRVFDSIISRLLANQTPSAEQRRELEAQFADQRSALLSQCTPLPDEVVQCLLDAPRPFDLSACAAKDRCALLGTRLEQLLKRDATVPRSKKAGVQALLADEGTFFSQCAGASRVIQACVKGATTWAEAMACGAR